MRIKEIFTRAFEPTTSENYGFQSAFLLNMLFNLVPAVLGIVSLCLKDWLWGIGLIGFSGLTITITLLIWGFCLE